MTLCTDVLRVIAGRSYLPEFSALCCTSKDINKALEPMLHEYKAKMNEIFSGSIRELTDRTNQAKEQLSHFTSINSSLKEEKDDVCDKIESLRLERIEITNKISEYVFTSFIVKIPLILKIIAFVESLFPFLKIKAIAELQELKIKLHNVYIESNQRYEELCENQSSINQNTVKLNNANSHFCELDTRLSNRILFTKIIKKSLPMSNLTRIEIKKFFSLDMCNGINESRRSTEKMEPNSQRIYIDAHGHRGLFFCDQIGKVSSIQEVFVRCDVGYTTGIHTYSTVQQYDPLYDPDIDYDFLNLNK